MIRKSQSCDIQLMPRTLQLEPRREAGKIQNTSAEFKSQLMPRMLQPEPRREAGKVQNTSTEFQSKIKETTSLKSIISQAKHFAKQKKNSKQK